MTTFLTIVGTFAAFILAMKYGQSVYRWVFPPKMKMTIRWTLDDGERYAFEYRVTDAQLTELLKHIPQNGSYIDNRMIVQKSVSIQ